MCLAATLATAGCVNLAPVHERPAAAVPPTFPERIEPDGETVAAALSWSEFFRDPRLRSLVETAISENRDLVIATSRIEQARARFRIQDSNRYPQVGTDASGTRSRSVFFGPNPELGGAFTIDLYNVSVGVTAFELDFFGRLANLSEAARAQYLASIAGQRALYLSLIREVASAYFELLEVDAQIELSASTAAARAEELRLARLRLDVGATSALDFRQAELLLFQAQQQLASERQAREEIRNALVILLGGKEYDAISDGLALEDQIAVERLQAGTPSELLLNRPDIIAAEQNLRAARANIGAARAAFFPNISLTGSAGFGSDDLSNLFSGDNFTWSYGPSISLPIFDWGRREADVALTRALETEALATYDLTVQTAFREVSDALAGRRWLAERYRLQSEALAAQEEIARLARIRYREGVVNYLEVLDAERSRLAGAQAQIELARLKQQNEVALFIALGGGLND